VAVVIGPAGFGPSARVARRICPGSPGEQCCPGLPVRRPWAPLAYPRGMGGPPLGGWVAPGVAQGGGMVEAVAAVIEAVGLVGDPWSSRRARMGSPGPQCSPCLPRSPTNPDQPKPTGRPTPDQPPTRGLANPWSVAHRARRRTRRARSSGRWPWWSGRPACSSGPASGPLQAGAHWGAGRAPESPQDRAGERRKK